MKPPGLSLLNMADDENAPIRGKAEFVASSWTGFGQVPPTTIFFLDGRPINQPGSQAQLSMDSERLFDGYHELRAVAYASDTIRHQGFDTRNFITRNRNRGVELGGYTNRQAVDFYHPVTFEIKAEGAPREVAIIAQERVLAREPYTSNMTMSVKMMHVGPGPVRFQAVVVYPDNEAVRSMPLQLDIQSLNQPPEIHAFRVTTNENGQIAFGMSVSDPENDPIEGIWYNDLFRETKAPAFTPAQNITSSILDGHSLSLAATSGVALAVYEIDQPHLIKEIKTRVRADATPAPHLHQAGVVFNYTDDQNYMFWGVSGYYSAWALIRVRDGKNELVMTRGAPVEIGRDYDLMMLSVGSQKMALFVNDNLITVADLGFSAGKVGVLSSTLTRFDHLLVSPPSATRTFFSEGPAGLVVSPEHLNATASLVGGARDVQLTTTKPLAQ